MSRLLVACAVLLGTASFAQAPAAPPPQPKATAPAAPEKPNPVKASAERTQAALARLPKAKPEDVKSQDAILKALYDVISGPAGAPRDWQRFRSLFYPGAQLIPLAKPPGAATLAAPSSNWRRCRAGAVTVAPWPGWRTIGPGPASGRCRSPASAAA